MVAARPVCHRASQAHRVESSGNANPHPRAAPQLSRLPVGGVQRRPLLVWPFSSRGPDQPKETLGFRLDQCAELVSLPASTPQRRVAHGMDMEPRLLSRVDNSACGGRFRRQARRRRRRSVLSNTSKELAPAAMSAKDEWTAKVSAKGDEVRKAKAAKADK